MIGKRRVKTRSKLLALLLSAVMLVSLIPLGTVIFQKAGAIGPGALYENYGVIDDDDGHKPSSIAAGQVWTDKLVEAVGEGQPEQFDITLKALAGKIETTSETEYDIIFLLDNSQSMDNEDIDTLRDAANSAIQAALSVNSSKVLNRVAVIKFARDASLITFGSGASRTTWLSNAITSGPLKSSHFSRASQQGTNMQAALLEAYNLLKSEIRAGAKPRIILMSDGAPNCYTKDNIFVENPPSSPSFTYDAEINGSDLASARTLLYAKWLTEKFANLQIYTVGFRVSESPRAMSVLNPSKTTPLFGNIQTHINNFTTYRPGNVSYEAGYYGTSGLSTTDLHDTLKNVVDTITGNIISGNLVIEDFVGAAYEFVLTNTGKRQRAGVRFERHRIPQKASPSRYGQRRVHL